MYVVDSKETPLPAPTVIIEFLRNYDVSGYPPEVAMIAISKEMAMPRTDLVQIGNTVFVGHYGTGRNKHKMVGRAFNVDTGKNFIRNGLRYFNYLQRKGYTGYVTEYDNGIFDSAFQIFKRRAEAEDSKMVIEKDGSTTMIGLKIGKQPYAEVP